jgi:hypothetical protein
MGRKLTSDMQATPVVSLTEKEGAFFQGVLVERKLVKTQWGERPLFNFELDDTDMRITKKEGKEYLETDVEQGATVAVFAPTMLDRALVKAEAGDKLKIVYTGLGKSAKKGRNAPHTFDVEII